MILLGIDPGFASFGYAVVRKYGGQLDLLAAGVLRTKKAAKKARVLATEDNLQRAQALCVGIDNLLGVYAPHAICAESMSFPRSSSVAAKMAMSWGVVAALATSRNIGIVQASPQAVKKALCGEASASKEEVQSAVDRRLPAARSKLVNLPGGQLEHPYDAMAAVIACMGAEQLRIVESVLRAHNPEVA